MVRPPLALRALSVAVSFQSVDQKKIHGAISQNASPSAFPNIERYDASDDVGGSESHLKTEPGECIAENETDGVGDVDADDEFEHGHGWFLS
jgi:hypothetical protein